MGTFELYKTESGGITVHIPHRSDGDAVRCSSRFWKMTKFTFHTGQMGTILQISIPVGISIVHIPHRSDGDGQNRCLLYGAC